MTKTRHQGEVGRALEVDTMIVTESRSTVTIMWQDGTVEKVLGTSVIPYLNVDEYDCWYVYLSPLPSTSAHLGDLGLATLSAGKGKTKPGSPWSNLLTHNNAPPA